MCYLHRIHTLDVDVTTMCVCVGVCVQRCWTGVALMPTLAHFVKAAIYQPRSDEEVMLLATCSAPPPPLAQCQPARETAYDSIN